MIDGTVAVAGALFVLVPWKRKVPAADRIMRAALRRDYASLVTVAWVAVELVRVQLLCWSDWRWECVYCCRAHVGRQSECQGGFHSFEMARARG
jgi:hypothetical protein